MTKVGGVVVVVVCGGGGGRGALVYAKLSEDLDPLMQTEADD